jgi:hypothetical protein
VSVASSLAASATSHNSGAVTSHPPTHTISLSPSSAQLGNLKKDDAGRFTGQMNNVVTTVEAKRGRALFFFHNLVHEGVPPADDEVKYIIRSDLM